MATTLIKLKSGKVLNAKHIRHIRPSSASKDRWSVWTGRFGIELTDDEHKELLQRLSVSSYPSLIYIQGK